MPKPQAESPIQELIKQARIQRTSWQRIGYVLSKIFWKKLRLLRQIFFSFLAISIILAIALQFSVVQTAIVRLATDWVSGKLKHKISIQNIKIDFWESTIQIKNLTITDLENKPMIQAQKLWADFDYHTITKNGDVTINDIQLTGGSLNIRYLLKAKDLNINLFIIHLDSLLYPTPSPPSPNPSTTYLKKISLMNFHFNYDDDSSLPISTPNIDWLHFGFHHIQAEIENLRLRADTVQMNIKQFKAQERKTQLKIHELKTTFDYASAYLHLNNLHLAVGNSLINKHLALDYQEPSDLSNFIEKVIITAYLDSAIIHSADLALIAADELKMYQDVWRIRGSFVGKVNNFCLRATDLWFGENTHFKGDFAFQGLPSVENLKMDLQIERAQFLPHDLRQYIPQEETNILLAQMGVTQLHGRFQGTTTHFSTQASVVSQVGLFKANITLALDEKEANSYYKGQILTQNLHIGKLLKLAIPLSTLNLQGEIEGTGFTPQTANFKLKAKIKEAIFNKYAYHDIWIEGKFYHKKFEGNCIAKDTNLNFQLAGRIDFNKQLQYPSKPIGEFNLKTQINRISLQPLGFADVPTIFSANLEANIQGVDLDSLTGNSIVRNLDLHYNKNQLHIDSLQIIAERIGKQQNLQVNSELLQVKMKGNFVFSQLLKDIPTMAQEYVLALKNKQEEIKKYYTNKRKQKKIDDYNIRFQVNFQDLNPILKFVDTTAYLSKNTRLEGFFENGKTETFRLKTLKPIDSLILGKNKIYGIKVDIETTKTADTTVIEAEIHVESNKQEIAGLKTEKFTLNLLWEESEIDFEAELYQQASANFIKLSGALVFNEDSLSISFYPSQLRLLENNWRISANNQINIQGSRIKIHNFALFNAQMRSSRIEANGEISEDPNSHLDLNIKDVELEGFANFLGLPVAGILNMTGFAENLYQKPVFLAEADLENLMYNNFLIGDLTSKIELSEATRSIQLSAYVYRLGKHIMDVAGTYQLEEKQNQLNIITDLKNTDLEIIEPFAQGIVSKLRGQLNGQLVVRGNLSHPIIEGIINLKNGGMKVNYLGTHYTMEGTIGFQNDLIDIQRFILRDEFRHRAMLSGIMTHKGFSHVQLDLKGRFNDFALLNTTIKDNNLFYGRAYATGNMEIKGSPDKLILNINARSEKDTKIILPLFQGTEVSSSDFIEFVSFKDTLQKEKATKQLDLSGLVMNFNLELNDNAEIEIIFDNRTGDIMRGAGRGNLQMKIDTRGEFGMFGTYTIEQGSYNFTLAGIMSKPFKVIPGSKITFVGDIFESILDIDAVYEKPVSLLPLIQTNNPNDLQNPELSRRYPIGVVLDLKGKLLNPEIKLNLDLRKAKSASNSTLQTAIANFETRIQSDEQELKRQAAGILIMNSLFRENSFAGASSSSALNSISEFVSNQLSHFISQVDENLDLNLEINPTDINASRMRFSYRMLDGRLRVTREGGFTNTQNQADFANVMGDWTIEYLLTKEGQLRAKMYTRNNQNLSQTLGTTAAPSSTLTGLSIMHTASFNTLKDFILKKEEKNRQLRSRIERKANYAKTLAQANSNTDIQNETKKDTTLQALRSYLKNRLGKVTFKRDTLQEDNEQIPEFYQQSKNETNKNTIEKKDQKSAPKNNSNSYLQGDEDNEPLPESLRKNNPTEKKTTLQEKEKRKIEKNKEQQLKGDEDNEPAPEFLQKKKEEKIKKIEEK
ncbi:MAG: translocation/assembly module TamB domain-containing protein [Microscillaceae bacterium]|nr:translocation/assembly module TamB domain-containing protein [Microscillaceae bacterium]MDW8461373.1 translocation/assembly module TamB domain-containing protein [Cytophagales bacterium]